MTRSATIGSIAASMSPSKTATMAILRAAVGQFLLSTSNVMLWPGISMPTRSANLALCSWSPQLWSKGGQDAHVVPGWEKCNYYQFTNVPGTRMLQGNTNRGQHAHLGGWGRCCPSLYLTRQLHPHCSLRLRANAVPGRHPAYAAAAGTGRYAPRAVPPGWRSKTLG